MRRPAYRFLLIGAVFMVGSLSGCSGSDTPPPTVTQTAAQSAGKIKPGMSRQDVEKVAMGKGAMDAQDPNKFHYPTGDGDVVVTYAGDQVTAVTTVNDR